MLGDKNAVATIAVKDLAKAKKFYEETLGLSKVHEEGDNGITYKSGNTNVFVYTSQFAGTNQATAASWSVGEDLEVIIKDLQAKGVTFEEYDMPGITREGVVHVWQDLKSAWFKDPDGNTLNIVNKM
jgi:catechol 2,3-dioxygenase-like lactoylglutathione lyase family enzyme